MTFTCCVWPVPRSFASMLTTPFASIRNVTWIFGTPRGAGGMPVSSKRARLRLSAAIWRSPWSTWIGTKFWLSTLVVKISLRSVGIGRVARDERGEDAAAGLDAERERRHVEEEHLVDLARP